MANEKTEKPESPVKVEKAEKIPMVFYATPRLVRGRLVLQSTTWAQAPGEERGPNSNRTVKVPPVSLELVPRDVNGYVKIDCKENPATRNPVKAFAVTPEQLARMIMEHKHFVSGKIITEAQMKEEVSVLNEAFDQKKAADERVNKLLGRKANKLGRA